MKPLPKSSSKFFKDADVQQVTTAFAEASCGDFIQRGGVVICQGCPNEHSMPKCELNHKGELVKK